MSALSSKAEYTRGSDPGVSCSGKVGFETYSLAEAVVSRSKKKPRPGRSVYRCGHCGLFHIGTDKGRVEKKRKADFKERKRHEDL